MLRRLSLLIILAFTWYLLSGHHTLLLLSLGIISSVISYYLYQRIISRCAIEPLNLRPVKLIVYSFWLLKEIIKSSIKVIRTIIFNQPISPQFFHLDTGHLNQLGKVIYANSITLTPGTVTIDVGEHSLHVYSLFSDAAASLENSEMRHKIEQLTNK